MPTIRNLTPSDLPLLNPGESVVCDNCGDEIPVGDKIAEKKEREEWRKSVHTFPWAPEGWPPPEGDPDPMPFSSYLYDTPWDDGGTWHHFCSKECESMYCREGDFSYFYCFECDRQICRQNPRNGYMGQSRWTGYGKMCLSCYQEFILENGIPKNKFQEGTVPGMFFNSGNPEPKKIGYEEVPEWKNVKVTSASEINNKALELIGKGYKVIVGYERLSIIGGEGYVTLMAKKEDL